MPVDHQGFVPQAGLFDLPAGSLAAAVTSLEMNDPPVLDPAPDSAACPPGVRLQPRADIGVADYRRLYRHVGEDWLWFSRLRMSDAELLAIIDDPQVDIYAVTLDGVEEGILELDFRREATCEIAFFGLAPALVGRGVGRWLMSRTLQLAWSRPIRRLWVHTCTWDHPHALAFYRASGFTPFRQQIEIIEDPRLDGTLRRAAAPHVPLLGQS